MVQGNDGEIREMKVEEISQSRIAMYLKCPRQYYYRYCEELICPPRAALTLGSSFHRAIAANYGQKVASHQDLAVTDVLDVFSTEFDHRRHETIWYPEEDPGKIKDSGIAITDHYQVEAAPGIQPVAVERSFEAEMSWVADKEPKSVKLKGIVDLQDENDTVVESKTTSKKPYRIKQAHIIQATCYVAGAMQEYGQARVDYVVNKKVPEIVSYPIQVDQSKVIFFTNLVASVVESIEYELWIPNRDHFLCSERWCGYWDLCHKRLGG